MSNTYEEWSCGCEFLNDERTKACEDHRNFKPSVTGFVVPDIHGIALANVSGALVDSGVVVPEDETRYGEAVREIVRERDAARAEVAKLRDYKFGPREIVQALGRQVRDEKARADAAERRATKLEDMIEAARMFAVAAIQEDRTLDPHDMNVALSPWEVRKITAPAILTTRQDAVTCAKSEDATPGHGAASVVSQLRELVTAQQNDEAMQDDDGTAPEAYLRHILRDAHEMMQRAIEGLSASPATLAHGVGGCALEIGHDGPCAPASQAAGQDAVTRDRSEDASPTTAAKCPTAYHWSAHDNGDCNCVSRRDDFLDSHNGDKK